MLVFSAREVKAIAPAQSARAAVTIQNLFIAVPPQNLNKTLDPQKVRRVIPSLPLGVLTQTFDPVYNVRRQTRNCSRRDQARSARAAPCRHRDRWPAGSRDTSSDCSRRDIVPPQSG